MNIKTSINAVLSIILLLLIAFSLNATLASTYSIQNIKKIRVLNDTYYVIDSAQNALYFGTYNELNSDQINMITTRQENDKEIPFKSLKDLTILQDGTIFLIDGIADGIFQYDSVGNFTKEHTRFEDGSSITKIISITNDYNNNVFALQYNNGYKVLKKGQNEEYFSVLYTLTNEELTQLGSVSNENALLGCDFEKEVLFIASQGALIELNSDSKQILCTYEGTATDIAVDYLGHPYLALDNGTILKCEDEVKYLELSVTTFVLNFENGNIIYSNLDNQILTFASDFVNNLSRFQHPVDYLALDNLNEGVSIYQTTEETYVYKYPLKVSQLTSIPANTQIIMLSNINSYPSYSYILLSLDNNLTPCYIQNDKITKMSSTPINQEMRTFTINTKLYKYPTADKSANGSSLTLLTIPQTTKVLVNSNVCDYADSEGRKFYEITYENKIYYVMQAMLTTLATEEGAITLKPANASLNADQSIVVYSGLNSSNTVGVLPKDAKFYVNLSTFSKNDKRTYIEYLDENNNYICGFIDTKYINIDELSPFVVVAIFLILIVIILILMLILYFAKEHKKIKEQLNNL